MTIRGVTGTDTDGVLSADAQRALDNRQGVAVQRILDHWLTAGFGKPYPMVALPTGFGKSRIIHTLVQNLDYDRVLVIVGSKNVLLTQSHRMFYESLGAEFGYESLSIAPNCSGRIVLATWQGLNACARRNQQLPAFDLVVADEVHSIGTKQRLQLLERLAPQSVIGLTATAHRSSGQFRLPTEYGFTLVDTLRLGDCIAERWLAPMVGIAFDTDIVLPKTACRGRYLSSAVVNDTLRRHPALFHQIGLELTPHLKATRMKTIIVVNRIKEEACVIADTLHEAGIPTGLAVNQTHAEALRNQFTTLDAVKRYLLPQDHPKALQVLISPQVITEGFDAPATECIVWAAPTLSMLRYTQVVGRGARRCLGKRCCLIIDFVYAIEGRGYCNNFFQFLSYLEHEPTQQTDGTLLLGIPGETTLTAEITHLGQYFPRITTALTATQPQYYPSPEDWLDARHLERILGYSIQGVLKILGIEGEKRQKHERSPRATMHYPPETVERIQQYIKERKELLTLNRIRTYLGTTTTAQAEQRLTELGITGIPVVRRGKEVLLYPADTVERLRQAQRALRTAHAAAKHVQPSANGARRT